MKNAQSVQRLVEHALAFAHAALDESTPHRVAMAKMYAAEVLPHIGRMRPAALTLSEARRLMEHVVQLRAVLEALDRKLEYRPQRESN